MKQVFSFKTFLLFALASSLLSFSRHNDRDEGVTSLCKNIEGKWKVTSYMEDGEEQMGEELVKVTMKFSDSNCEGEFLFIVLHTDDEDEDEIRGNYLIYEEIGKIRLDPDEEEDARTFNLKIKGNELEMSGNVDGSRATIKAKRR